MDSAVDLKPIIGIACNFRAENGFAFHVVGDRYVRALADEAEAVPVLLPALGADTDMVSLMAGLDGVLLTGGASNVEPDHYGGHPPRDTSLVDRGRDGVALAAVRQAVATGVPLLGICRGLQEINVAFGGSLHQHLHEVPGRHDHRMERQLPMGDRLRPRQYIRLTPGGLLAEIAGGAKDAVVNTLHGQGVDRLGEGLTVEALADDGTVEALSVDGASAFALGVQWHAEYEPADHPLYRAIFQRFGAAARTRSRRRMGLLTG